jgi:hypothetical protein
VETDLFFFKWGTFWGDHGYGNMSRGVLGAGQCSMYGYEVSVIGAPPITTQAPTKPATAHPSAKPATAHPSAKPATAHPSAQPTSAHPTTRTPSARPTPKGPPTKKTAAAKTTKHPTTHTPSAEPTTHAPSPKPKPKRTVAPPTAKPTPEPPARKTGSPSWAYVEYEDDCPGDAPLFCGSQRAQPCCPWLYIGRGVYSNVVCCPNGLCVNAAGACSSGRRALEGVDRRGAGEPPRQTLF